VYETSYFDSRRGREIAVPKYSGMRGRNGLYLYPENDISMEGTTWLVVVEGELDAVRLWQAGIPAVSTTNGAGQVHRIPALLREKFPQITTLFIATDKDEPGREADRQTVTEARRLGFEVTEISWPEEWGKDITEFFLQGHQIEEAYFVGDYATLPD
jgi:DNA primase